MEKNIIFDPLIILYRQNDELMCNIVISDSAFTYRHYGIAICDVVRHVAQAFHVSEDAVWEWVEKERFHPTTSIRHVN